MNCPQCSEPIRWHHIAFAAFPVWVKCKNCKTKLVGNILIKIQVVIAILLGFILGLYIANADLNLTEKTILAAIGVSAISIPNIWLAIAKGQYHIKK